MVQFTKSAEKAVAAKKEDFLYALRKLGLKAEMGEITVGNKKFTRITLGNGIVLSGKEPHGYSLEKTELGSVLMVKWANDLKYTDSFGNEKRQENADRVVFEGENATLHSHHVSPHDGETLAVLVKGKDGQPVKGENGRYVTRNVEDPSEARLTATYSMAGAELEEKR